MTELGQQPRILDFAESHLFNSTKCFAVFTPEAGSAAEHAAAYAKA